MSATVALTLTWCNQALAACLTAETAVNTAKTEKQVKLQLCASAKAKCDEAKAAPPAGVPPLPGDQVHLDFKAAKLLLAMAKQASSNHQAQAMTMKLQVGQLASGSRSNAATPTKPTMGGLAQGQYGVRQSEEHLQF